MKRALGFLVESMVLVWVVGLLMGCSSTTSPAAATAGPAVLHTGVAATTAASTTAPTAALAAAPVSTPSPLDLVPRITVDELRALMDTGASVAILDVRPKESYDLGHIKGAVSFPWKPQLSFLDVEMLPGGDPIVTYCDCGPGEHDSADVAVQLKELGATAEFMVLAHPAIEGWIELGYPRE